MNNTPSEWQIIVVEDEIEALEDLLELLEIEGFDAVGFQDGAAAMTALERSPQAILITDLEMPGMNGRTLLRLAADIHSLKKMIVISGHSDFKPALNGNFAFLKKPIDFKILMAEIRSAFGS